MMHTFFANASQISRNDIVITLLSISTYFYELLDVRYSHNGSVFAKNEKITQNH